MKSLRISCQLFLYHTKQASVENVDRSITISIHVHFNGTPLYKAMLAMINLYSTMLLLYHLCDDRGIDCKPIYIPLCFYFIGNYFSDGFGGYAHLHSTMLLLYQINSLISSCSSLFTFHYASTLSATAFNMSKAEFNLHSTMLLLYPNRIKVDGAI